MQNKLVTIITVCFNCANELEKTIKSVIAQTYSNFEYIIIDGFSTDGTTDIIRKYEDKISLWVSEPDKGIYDAMNKGINYAQGKWINFMNAGDCFVSKDTLNNVFEKRSYSEKIKIIYGDVILDKNNDLINEKASPISCLSYKMPFCHQSSFAHIDLAKKYNFDLKYRIAADYNFFYNAYYTLGKEVFAYNEETISLCETSSSFSRTNQYPLWLEYLKIRSQHKNARWFWDKFKNVIKIFCGYQDKIK